MMDSFGNSFLGVVVAIFLVLACYDPDHAGEILARIVHAYQTWEPAP